MATLSQANMAIITGWIYYPEFLFIKKFKFLYKSGRINRLDILSVDILSGVYCTVHRLYSLMIICGASAGQRVMGVVVVLVNTNDTAPQCELLLAAEKMLLVD